MIEDKELNALFRQESQEHLDALEAGLLALEKDPLQPDIHERVMREAHSLKGAARMLDLGEIEALSHQIETQLRQQIEATDGFGAEITRKLLQVIDQLRHLSRIAVDGEADTDLNALSEADSAVATPSEQSVEAPPESAPEQTAPSGTGNLQPSELLQEAPRIDTVRIATEKLDRLMIHTGELQVLEKRITGQTRLLDEVSSLVDSTFRLQRAFDAQLNRLPASAEQKNLVLQVTAISEAWAHLSGRCQSLTESINQDVAYLQSLSVRLDDSVRELRMMPLSVLFEQFRRMIRDLSEDLGKPVDIIVDGADLMVDKRVIEELKDPLMHLLRNSLEHGLETVEERLKQGKAAAGMIQLRGIRTTSAVMVEVEDDGRGLNLERIRDKARRLGIYTDQQLNQFSVEQIQNLIFRSGLSTQDQVTDISGRGVGLDVVRTALNRLKGDILINSQPGQGTGFRLIIPQTFATTNVTLIRVKGQIFAVPLDSIHSIRFVGPVDIGEVSGQPTIKIGREPVSLVLLEELLGLGQRSLHAEGQHVTLVIRVDDRLLALVVEEVLEEQSIVIKPLGAFLKRVRNIAGVGLLGNGDIVAMLAPRDLISSVKDGASSLVASNRTASPGGETVRVLLAEDSMITRTQEKRILEAAGYEVIVAVDGQDAWSKINSMSVDAVVSDIMMPNVDGFELTRRIRSDKRFNDIPVILVTTLSSDEDRKRGLELGANAYISKGGFNQKMLLDALDRLLGASDFDS